jgi:nitroimidazol reductase NimA-like FMN-containing flavoprotein (pyridoxamine 5'-phosphate oxidase superfamily)
MFDEKARAFLSKPLIARMSTIDREGFPHTVPVWFKLDGEDVVVMGTRDTRKVGHMKANPKGCVSIGGEPGDDAGYLIKGEWRAEEDPGKHWQTTITRHYEPPQKADADLADWAELDIIVMRLKTSKVIKVA